MDIRAGLQGLLTSTALSVRKQDDSLLFEPEQGDEHPALGARRVSLS